MIFRRSKSSVIRISFVEGIKTFVFFVQTMTAASITFILYILKCLSYIMVFSSLTQHSLHSYQYPINLRIIKHFGMNLTPSMNLIAIIYCDFKFCTGFIAMTWYTIFCFVIFCYSVYVWVSYKQIYGLNYLHNNKITFITGI